MLERGFQRCQPEEADQLQHLIHLSHLESSHGQVHHLTPLSLSHCTKRCPVLLAVVREVVEGGFTFKVSM